MTRDPRLPRSAPAKGGPRTLTRRQWLGTTGLAGAGLLAAQLPFAQRVLAEGRARDKEKDPHFLIVLCAAGGASQVDGPLAVAASECPDAATLNVFADDAVKQVAGTPFRAVDQKIKSLGPIPMGFQANQSDFVKKHAADMMVSTWSRTSVNHFIAQNRSVTGNEAWSGRTLQEAVATHYGAGYPLPNVMMMQGSGYTKRGKDDSVPSWAVGEVVPDPRLYPFSLDGVAGVPHAPSRALVQAARKLRADKLEPASRFSEVFGDAKRLQHWRSLRGARQQALEQADLITKLTLYADSASVPLQKYGLKSSPAAPDVTKVFPDFQVDPLEAQAASAFLLLKYRLSVSVTIGPGFGVIIPSGETVNYTGGGKGLQDGEIRNPPIAFDFSHQGHRSTQAFMWRRLYRVIDGLATLLKSEPFGDQGQSLWDRTLVYMATDFGRSRSRPKDAADFGTSHDLNNGVLCVSPLVNGNKVLGGVDPKTTLTYGFDPKTGEPDKGRTMEEREIYSGILGALKVDTAGSGLPDVPAMRKA